MRRGFTIMEILVGIALLAFLSMLIFGIVSAMFSAERDLNELVEVHHMARVSMERMTRDLSQAYLSVNRGPEENTKTVFVGERDRVLFAYVGNMPTMAGALETDQGVVEFRLGRTSKNRNGRDLIRRFKTRIDDDPEADGHESVLASGVKKFELAYYNQKDEEWEDEWEAVDLDSVSEHGFKLPPRVRIHLELYDAMEELHIFETQTSIHMLNPLLFGKATSKSGLLHEGKKAIDKLKKGFNPLGGFK
ncbi:MAG TPA: prepilin-type N-terminal cleavage/methylation domain-containing protein [Myxococcales bacterium]|nr:prepilin-type N-terminal cleavage/methylation domain-containing protein [Myxococcales bacterium]